MTASHTLMRTLLFHILFPSNIQVLTSLNTPIRQWMRICSAALLFWQALSHCHLFRRKVTETGQRRCCSHLPKHQPPAKTGAISWQAQLVDRETKANQFSSVSPWLLVLLRPSLHCKNVGQETTEMTITFSPWGPVRPGKPCSSSKDV